MKKLASDSNCLTYLVEATTPGYDPRGDRSKECRDRVAMIRILLYLRGEVEIYVLPAVKEEYDRIPDEQKRFLHDNMIILDYDPWKFYARGIADRKQYFLSYHNKEKDCQILAEAEAANINILLSNDTDFLNRLKDKAQQIKIMQPSNYWESMKIPLGINPKLQPNSTNPLSIETWWQWNLLNLTLCT